MLPVLKNSTDDLPKALLPMHWYQNCQEKYICSSVSTHLVSFGWHFSETCSPKGISWFWDLRMIYNITINGWLSFIIVLCTWPCPPDSFPFTRENRKQYYNVIWFWIRPFVFFVVSDASLSNLFVIVDPNLIFFLIFPGNWRKMMWRYVLVWFVA